MKIVLINFELDTVKFVTSYENKKHKFRITLIRNWADIKEIHLEDDIDVDKYLGINVHKLGYKIVGETYL